MLLDVDFVIWHRGHGHTSNLHHYNGQLDFLQEKILGNIYERIKFIANIVETEKNKIKPNRIEKKYRNSRIKQGTTIKKVVSIHGNLLYNEDKIY